jgi:hypothetical protein
MRTFFCLWITAVVVTVLLLLPLRGQAQPGMTDTLVVGWPKDQSTVSDPVHLFRWEAPFMSLTDSSDFDVVVVERLPGQNVIDALAANTPVYQIFHLADMQLLCNGLQSGKSYAWRLTWHITSQRPKYISRTFSFSVN